MESKIESKLNLLTPILRISWNDLTIGSLLGHGGYGDVYQGQWYGVSVAIKKLYLKTLPEHLIENFIHETQIMARCNFPQIVRLYGVCVETGYYAMVMEYMPQGSLYHLLQNQERELPWSKRYEIAINIGQGLSFLHGQDILHRDLKSLNVLLDQHFRAKISDFGLAKIKLESSSSSTKNHKGMGTTRWLAPELISLEDDAPSATKASDIYSYGMVLWEMSAREIPFKNAKNEVVASTWIMHGKKETIPQDCPVEYAQIIQKTWGQPEARPTAREITFLLEQAKPQLLPPVEKKVIVEKSWHFDISKQVISKPLDKAYELLPASKKDIQKVFGFYQPNPVPGYEISSVQVIYNPAINRQFSLQLELLQHRDQNPNFIPRWPNKKESVESKAWREKIYQQFEDMTHSYKDTDYPAVKLLPTWHGTRPEILDSLLKTGYAALANTDPGFFGRGIYSAREAEYVYRVYNKGILLVNWVACFSAYPVIDDDTGKFICLNAEGQYVSTGPYENYDAHFVPVVKKSPVKIDAADYYPTKPNQTADCYELVVFQSAQCLPRYVVTLQAILLKHVVNSQSRLMPGESEYHVGNKLCMNGQYQSSLAHFESAANQGYFAAYVPLWLLYAGEMGAFEDEQKKQLCQQQIAANIDWFHIEAEKGGADAQANLGACYYYGWRVNKDEIKAIKYYRLAAEQGSARAQFILGECYQNGIGVTTDLVEAVKYYQMAAKQEHAAAQFNLGLCYQNGEGITKDLAEAVKYYQMAAEHGNADAQWRLGVRYQYGEGVITKNLAKAVKCYQMAAEQGNADAQWRLGWCYRYGSGIKKDLAEAVKYYQLAAEQGNAKAQWSLGWCYQYGLGIKKNLAEAVKYYQLSAEQGNAYAQWSLGWCYQYGIGITIDLAIAVKYYRLAAEQENANAQWSLGWCYQYGSGITKDDMEAVKYYRLAAAQRHPKAQCNLGWCYQHGSGITKDDMEAVKCYHLAAEQGDVRAQSNLGWCYFNGSGVTKDLTEAVKYYRLAAEQGLASAQYSLGLRYHNGEGVTKDLNEAVKYYRLAAEQGYLNAQANLGWCYENGWGVTEDLTEAVKYYHLAAKQGEMRAQCSLGICYENGEGVTKDLNEAVKYYRLAAEQGHADAKANLQILLTQYPHLRYMQTVMPQNQFFSSAINNNSPSDNNYQRSSLNFGVFQ